MSDLFVAAGRIRKNPADPKGQLALVETAEIVGDMTLPYGLTADVWGQVVDRSDDLSEALSENSQGLDADDITEMATELHAIMRQLV